ncbi:MAG: hypothetical protein ACN4GZ_08195 [Acidimicrobiales bacterium]
MTSGAKNKAHQLAEAAGGLIEQRRNGDDGEVPASLSYLAAHGINRGVDREVRRLRMDGTPWGDLDPDTARPLVEIDPGLVVLLGAHRNGYVREVVVQHAGDLTHIPGVVSMLAFRCVDRVPPISESAQASLRSLLAVALDGNSEEPMTTVINRAAKGIVVSPDSVIHCPDLVVMALKLFETRAPRWRRDRGRDHHERTLKEVDRRSQVLEHLRHIEATLDDDASRAACTQLIEFYEHSLVMTPRGVSPTT